jgi:hypothetical protein
VALGSPDLGVTRRTRGARCGSPDPAGLPDRQVSLAHRRPRFQRCSCLQSLRQNEGDLSVKHLGGVRRPAPSAGSWAGSGDRAQRGFLGGVRRPAPSAGSWAGSGDPRPARARSRVAYNKQLRNIKKRKRGRQTIASFTLRVSMGCLTSGSAKYKSNDRSVLPSRPVRTPRHDERPYLPWPHVAGYSLRRCANLFPHEEPASRP